MRTPLTSGHNVVQGKIKELPWFTHELQQEAVNNIHEYLRKDKNRIFSREDVWRVKTLLRPRPLPDTSRDAVVQMRGWLEVWVEFYTKVGDEAKVQKVKELQAPLVYETREKRGLGFGRNDNGMEIAARHSMLEVQATMITVADDAIGVAEDSQQLLALSTVDSGVGIEKKKRHKKQQNEEDVQDRTKVDSPSFQTPLKSNPHSQNVSESSQRAQTQPSTRERQLQILKRHENGAQSQTRVNAAPPSGETVEHEGKKVRSGPLGLNDALASWDSELPQRRRRRSNKESELTGDSEEPSKKHRPDSHKQSPLTAATHPRPTKSTEGSSATRTPQPKDLTEAHKRKQNVEAYIQRAKDLNKPDLATFIEKAHNLSLKDQKTAGLVDTILSQEPTSDQIATLQTIFDDLKSENRKSHGSDSAHPPSSASPASPAKRERIVKLGNRAKTVTYLSVTGSGSPLMRSRRPKRPNQDMEWKRFDPSQAPQGPTTKKNAGSGPTWSDKYNPDHPAYMYRHANYPNYATSARKREKDKRQAGDGEREAGSGDDDSEKSSADDGDDE